MNPVEFATLPAAHGQRIGLATLNSEKSLNALTLDMIRRLDARLAAWAQTPDIACVVLRGAGERAFCAGGDVRALRTALIEAPAPAPHPAATAFFAEEYTLDYRIHRYPKPIIVWGGGIVMGGGLGLLAGASHRVLTPDSRIAMPEITIGLYPDVGGSHFLARMPGRIGAFLALTGAPLDAGDALRCGLGDHVLRRDGFDAMLEALTTAPWPDDAQGRHDLASACLSAQETDTPAAGALARHFDPIRRLMQAGTLEQVAHALDTLESDDPWLSAARDTFRRGSPTSAALAWEAIRRARHLSLAAVFRMELTLSVNVCARPDFIEGVRALLVDKDRRPAWCRARAALDRDWIEAHFLSPWTADRHPLAGLETQVAAPEGAADGN